MAVVRELDERMTMNVQSWKKLDLQKIAFDRNISDSKLLLMIVDDWLERHNGGSTSARAD